MDYKYTTTFNVTAQLGKTPDLEISQASLDELREKVVPKNLDLDVNKDLLPIAFNAFVANEFNMNDDGVSGKTAKNIAASFVNKPINIEHDRETIVGFITNHSFTSMDDNIVLSNKEVNKLIEANEKFNVALGGVIWRVANDALADYLVESDEEDSGSFMSVSASWELGFGEARIATTEGNSRAFADATFVDDPDDMEKLSAHLKSSGGKGKVDGKNVYREVVGSPLPLGIGLTETPAAKVKGVATIHTLKTKKNSKAQIELSEEVVDKIAEVIKDALSNKIIDSLEKADKNLKTSSKELKEKIEIKSSQNKKVNVNRSNKKIMDIPRDIKEITANWLESEAHTSAEKFRIISDVITEKSKEYEKTLEERGAEAKAIEEAKAQTEKSLSETQTKLEKLQQQFDELTADKLEREAQDSFDARMASFEDKYELSDEQRKAIASQIKNVCDDKYEGVRSSIEVLLKDSEKEAIAAKQEEDAAAEKKAEEELKTKEAKASTEKGIESILDGAFLKGEEKKDMGSTTSSEEDKYADLKAEFSFDKVLV